MINSELIGRARDVIQKNLKTVQQIAFLLGENAADSEIILNSQSPSTIMSRLSLLRVSLWPLRTLASLSQTSGSIGCLCSNEMAPVTVVPAGVKSVMLCLYPAF